jgi:hypothetical protein
MNPENRRALEAVAAGDAYGDTIALRSRRLVLTQLEARGLIVQTKPTVFKSCFKLTAAGELELGKGNEER